MPSNTYFSSGVDFTAYPLITDVSPSQLSQGINLSKPAAGFGMVILSVGAPDIVTYPELARFLWLPTSGGYPTGAIYTHDGSAWTPIAIANGANITPNSIPLSKILRAGTALQIPQLDATAANLVWVSVLAAITNGSLTLAKLAAPGAGNLVLGSTTSAWATMTVDQLAALITAGIITFTQIGATGAVAGEAFKRNTANDAWIPYTPGIPLKTAVLSETQTSGTAGGTSTATTWHKRALNTVTSDLGTLVTSLSTGVFTLEAGTYEMIATASCNQGTRHRLRVACTTVGAPVPYIYGTSGDYSVNGSNEPATATVKAVFYIVGPASNTFELQHYITTGEVTNGLGFPDSIAGVAECYSQIKITKLS